MLNTLARDHTHVRKLLQVVCASVWCLFAAGIIFGFAAFKIVLIQEGVYSDICDQWEYYGDGNGSAARSIDSGHMEQVCAQQDLKLNNIFTVSAGVTNIMALPVGYILDTFGPRISGIVGSLLLAVGAIMFIFGRQLYPIVDPYMLGYVSFAMGGPFVFISCFQLANSFPKRSGTILAIITGCFDTSSALFLGYRLLYQSLDSPLTLQKFFTVYLLVPTFIVLCQCTIMPHESYKTISTVAKITIEGLDENGNLIEGDNGSGILSEGMNPQEREALLANRMTYTTDQQDTNEFANQNSDPHEGGSALRRRKSVLENYVENKLTVKTDGVFGVLHDVDAWSQIKTPWFYLMMLFASIAMIRINYFIATVRSQEEYLLGDKDMAAKMNGIFDIALPVGGIIAIPIIGFILDHVKPINTLIIVSSLSITIGLLGLIPNSFYLNLLGILLLVVYRPFYYTVVSDYCSKVFGFTTFGTVYGLLTCICGMFNMIQSVLDQLTHTTFQMDPTPVNVLLLSITICCAVPLILYTKRESVKRRNQRTDAIVTGNNHDINYNSI